MKVATKNLIDVCVVIIMLIAILAIALIFKSAQQSMGSKELPEDPAPAIERIYIASNVTVIMDHTTGCQYIETAVGITPRMYSNEVQYCIDTIDQLKAEEAYLFGEVITEEE